MRWSVGVKIAAMEAIAIIALIIIGFASYYSTDRMLASIDWRQHTYQVKAELSTLLSLLIDAETAQRGYLITKQERYLEPYNFAIGKISGTFNDIRTLTADNDDEQHRLDMMWPLIQDKLSGVKQSFTLTDSKQIVASLDDGKKQMDEIRNVISDMNNAEDALLAQRISGANTSVNDAFFTIVYGTLGAVIFLVIIGILFTRHIATPLREMTVAARKIADGELDDSFKPISRQDEVGDLSETFARMSRKLQDIAAAANTVSTGDLTVSIVPISHKDILGNSLAKMVENLRQFALDNNEFVQMLNTSVNEIFTSVSQLVSSGSETATAVSQTTSTIEEVRQTSQISNQKAKSVSDGAQTAVQISENGKKTTMETNDGMMRIRDQMAAIAESMLMLSEQTQGISSIVETVDDLAQQSNLLSVNASIEAEKAGEQGKGFRIVAQEIKSLADQSKQATHRVREILSDVQKATSSAVLATEQGNKAAQKGVKKSEETGDAIAKLSVSVGDAAQAAIQIAASSQQQLIGMEQAALAMENIKQASLQNVDSARQLETAAHNLKGISVKLEQLVNKYKLSTEQQAKNNNSIN